MIVLVDTPIWSFAYRRAKRTSREALAFDAWSELVRRQEAVLIGPVRQEVLCGFANTKQFETLRLTLRAFIDLRLVIEDYEHAAEFYDRCRQHGAQGSPTDFFSLQILLSGKSPSNSTPIPGSAPGPMSQYMPGGHPLSFP